MIMIMIYLNIKLPYVRTCMINCNCNLQLTTVGSPGGGRVSLRGCRRGRRSRLFLGDLLLLLRCSRGLGGRGWRLLPQLRHLGQLVERDDVLGRGLHRIAVAAGWRQWGRGEAGVGVSDAR